ncbi:MAG: CatB-related O-acetyltransferase [Colwellia sp.]
MIIKSILSQWYRRFKLIYSQKNNRVFSYEVHCSALQGQGIEVREGTLIDPTSIIGSYSYVGRNCSITKSSIGRYCSIANNVSIGQGEHELDRISTNSIFYDDPYEILTSKVCNIGHDVWIGVDAIILRGVTIGIGAVIGANSVVTKNVPPFAIVVGSPAKIIRYRFQENNVKNILDSEWWNKTPEEARNIFVELNIQ